MKKFLIVREVLNGLVKLVKEIRCRIACCCESECNAPNETDKIENIKEEKYKI